MLPYQFHHLLYYLLGTVEFPFLKALLLLNKEPLVHIVRIEDEHEDEQKRDFHSLWVLFAY